MISTCLHTDAASSRIPMLGSRLVLCRICWLVIDPMPAAPRRGLSRAEFVEKPVEAKTEKPKSLPVPEPADDFSVPMPRSRKLSPGLRDTFRLTLAVLLILFLVYAAWFTYLYHPSFEEHLDPTQSYRVAFPGQPVWSGGSLGGSDGQVVRNRLGINETYQIRVTHRSEWQFGRISSVTPLDSATLSRFISSRDLSYVRPRSDLLLASAAVEYERWLNGKIAIVGRILVIDDLVYEMTVKGARISMKDSRVQRFFNSFRLEPP